MVELRNAIIGSNKKNASPVDISFAEGMINYLPYSQKNVFDFLISKEKYLEEYFKNVMNIKFTAEMESKLDDVEIGKEKWQDIVSAFYDDFSKQMEYASKQMGVSMPKPAPEPSDIKCDKCGSMMVYRDGKFGKFLACSKLVGVNFNLILKSIAICDIIFLLSNRRN